MEGQSQNRPPIELKPGQHQKFAKIAIEPAFHAALMVQNTTLIGLPVTELAQVLPEVRAEIAAIGCGTSPLSVPMLAAQAYSLNALFSALADHALSNAMKHVPTAEAFMRLALKAQNQCRITLESLEHIRNPSSVAFVRQTNIAHGPQQVNNGVTTGAEAQSKPASAGADFYPKNELLELTNGEGVDRREASSPKGIDQSAQTLASFDRTSYRPREDAIGAQLNQARNDQPKRTSRARYSKKGRG